jgi:hypothetical protein
VVVQPKCFQPPPKLNKSRSRRDVGDDDLWTELETADWGEAAEDDCSLSSAGLQLSDLSLEAMQKLPSLVKLLNEEDFSLELGKDYELCFFLFHFTYSSIERTSIHIVNQLKHQSYS